MVRVGPNKLYIRKTSGSGTNAPNPNAGNDHWDQVAGSLPIQLWLTRQVHPNLALPLPIPQAMDPQTAGLPGEWDLVLFEATLTGTFGAGTYNAVRGPVRHTWDPCADIAVASDYVSRIGLSVINSATVRALALGTFAEFPGGTNNCVGFILENRADLVFRFEPYFSVLSSLMLTESSTALGYLADNLDAHTRCFYASGTTNRTHWQPELNQSRDDVKNFPLRLGKRDGEQGTSDDLLTFAHSSKAPYARLSDSNDATAGLFALAAVRYFRYGGNDGKDWMEDNFEAVSNALLRNVVMRRRGINHSTAYGTANSIPTSGSGQTGRSNS
ncbi:MAG: hypothetical protein K8H99_02595, partial [Nitrospirae bacterium]|nr:hypothetical protein [Fimbriimonadaceae bacterium]